MGARPLALMNALRFGDPANARTAYLIKNAVKGIGTYGNCVGVPTVGGELMFHKAYDGNCLVNAFALGLVDHDKIFLGRAAGVGNSVIYFGSKTGRDGIHGATMASEVFDEDSQEKRPTVQVGDPFQEKLLIEACLEIMQTGAVVGIQDMGAAGMTSSTYEMAERAGTGVRIHLDRVPQRESGMNPYELMLSESQERMLAVVEAGRESEVFKICSRWELDAVKIGEVIPGNEVELFWQGECISSLPVAVVTNSVPNYRWPEARPVDYDNRLSFDINSVAETNDLTSAWLKLLGSVNLCSRRPVYNQYDSTVRSNTVIHPGGDAAVIRVKSKNRAGAGGVEKGVALTLDCNSRYCSIDPRQGAALTLAESIRNLAAVGAEPVGISDCLNFGSPLRPEGMWELAEAIRGLAEAARAFEVPVVSGNVSLYNETKGQPILPTPLLAVVGLIADAGKCVGSHFIEAGERILVFGVTDGKELGGSEYLAEILGIEKGPLPQLDYDLEDRHAAFIRALIDGNLIRSCHDISGGGLAVALAECCFSPYAAIGAQLKIDRYQGRKDGLLFAETGARYIVSCDAMREAEIRALADRGGIPIMAGGIVGGDSIDICDYAVLDLAGAYELWQNGLRRLFE